MTRRGTLKKGKENDRIDENVVDIKLHAITVSNNFPYNSIILESERLSPIYTSRISHLSTLEIFLKKFFVGKKKKRSKQTKLHHEHV